MGFAVLARPALFLQLDTAKSGSSDGRWDCAGGGESVTSNSVKFSNKKQKQGYTTSVKRFVAEKAAIKWFSKLNNGGRIVHCPSSPLPSPNDDVHDCQQIGSVSEKSKPAIFFKAAQKLGSLGRKKTAGGSEKTSLLGKTSIRRTKSFSSVGRVANYSRVVTASKSEDESCFRGPANKRPVNQPSNGAGRAWTMLGGAVVAAGTVATAGAALRGFESGSALASSGDGGFGQSGTGHGGGGGGDWNGGGGENGGFDAGGGEGFIADSIYDSNKEHDSFSPKSISLVRKNAAATRPSLASLSSAAGDFIDGEAPLGGDYTSTIYSTTDSYPVADQLKIKSHYSPATVPQDHQKYGERSNFDHDEDLFFGSEVEERPLGGVPQDLRRKNEAFQTTRSRPSNLDPSSGKPLSPNQTLRGNYNAYEDQHRIPFQYHASSDGQSHPIPEDFTSFGPDTRTTLTSEPRGIGQERSDGTDFSSWVSGLFDTILGKRSGGQGGGAEGKPLDDDEKKGLVAETAALALKLLSEKGDDFAKKFETNALRRLQRETFSDLLKVRERLDKLEHKTGLRGRSHGDALTSARTNLRGEVNAGGAFVIVEDSSSAHSRASLQYAGLKTGLDVRFTFTTPMRDGDMLTTQCGVGQGSGMSDDHSFGGPLILQKINYLAQINDSLSVSVAPLGARASDMSDTVNHLQGQALTTFAGTGPALYQNCKGSAIGASLRSSSVLLSMSQFLSGWGSTAPEMAPEPLCLSTLAQFMVQPCDHLVLSLSAVNNVWPSPPSPTFSGFHWSEMGPLVLCKTVTRPTGAFIFNPMRPSAGNSIILQGNAPTESWSAHEIRGSRGIAMQSVALAGEVDLGHKVSVGGWAQVERGDWLQELEKKEFQWNVSIAKCTGQNVNWGLSIGRRKREDWHEDGLSPVISDGPYEPSTSQMQMEAFVRMGCGKGFNLQSGIVYIVDKHSQTPALMLRSSWTM